MAPLSSLSEADREILHRCLRVAAEDQSVFPDWEFHSLFGLWRPEFQAIVDSWPNLDESSEEVELALNNTLNNLLGYPHDHHDDWDAYFGFGWQDVRRILTALRGKMPSSYFDGMM
jgi:hypothetical protein